MIALKHVLVPTDFSETSDVALKYGKAFAAAFGATLHVVHVIEEPYGQPWAVEAYGFSLAALQDEWIKEAKGRMEKILTDEERASLKAVTTTVLGHPVMEIQRYAKDNNIDLIVMGTHGRGPLGHVVMGSVAERLVRKSPCPVLTVRSEEREFVG
ncbi:MAG: universal stress protein [Acidobacteria bacterium]|nr:universal stress protein [Acidobacteriota bacterium]